MLKKTGIFAALAFIGLTSILSSCETEVDLMAPYKSTPVIIGVLDHTVDTQFVRINRTFLGPGDVEQYAAISDSVEYDESEVDAWIIKYNGNNLVDSIQLLPIRIPSREAGIFYENDVLFYYTAEELFTESETSNLENMSYRLRATLRGTTYRATAPFPRVTQSNIDNPGPTPEPVEQQFITNGIFRSVVPFRYNANASTFRYDGALRINFDCDKADGSTVTDQYIDYPLGIFRNSAGDGGGRNFDFSAEQFYSYIGTRFNDIPDLEKVRIQNIEYRLTGSNQDLNSYIAVAQPVSQFVPVLTNYTNISGGAIGIFAAKVQVGRSARLNTASIEALNNSSLTSGPCYCVTWPNVIYNCTPSATDCP